jgi:hypothetical protein
MDVGARMSRAATALVQMEPSVGPAHDLSLKRRPIVARPHNLDIRLPSADREAPNVALPVTIIELAAAARRSSERRSVPP